MRIATAIFNYNRPDHTKQVIEGTLNNTHVPEKVFLFQDGLKYNTPLESWNEVNSLIKSYSCEKTEIIVSDYNKGLANSIIDGVTRILNEYDAVIVLEDDCVPSRYFIDYMYACLMKYEMNKKVWQISGYGWPFVDKCGHEEDVYFCGRMSSWGWGTWKDRWFQIGKGVSQGYILSFSLFN